jgi:hypothetical protein
MLDIVSAPLPTQARVGADTLENAMLDITRAL